LKVPWCAETVHSTVLGSDRRSEFNRRQNW